MTDDDRGGEPMGEFNEGRSKAEVDRRPNLAGSTASHALSVLGVVAIGGVFGEAIRKGSAGVPFLLLGLAMFLVGLISQAIRRRTWGGIWWAADLLVAGLVGALALPAIPGGNGVLVAGALMFAMAVGKVTLFEVGRRRARIDGR